MPAVDGGPRGIDVDAVTRWLAGHVEGLVPPVELELVSGGRSNLTYKVTDTAGAVRALRRPPTGGVLSTAHDMSREWAFISALAPTPVPVPEPLAYCADADVTGAPFYVMSYVPGLVLADEAAGGMLPREARRRAAEETIDTLAALHAIEPERAGLAGFARPGNYVERQLHRWHRQVHQSGAPDLALLDEVHSRLLAHVPAGPDGVVHGDFRPGNIAFGADGRVHAVFDWELATLGDSLADLGWLLSSWAEPGDPHPPTTPGPSLAPGFPGRAELARRYARRTGRDLSELPYYIAFSRWRSACIGAGVLARYLAGVMGDDGYDPGKRGETVTRQAEAALEAIAGLHPTHPS